MDSEHFKGGAILAAKVAATAIPSAVAVDVALAQAPALTYYEREGARVGIGAMATLALLAVGAPVEFAAGPLVGNATVTATNAAQNYGLAAMVRDAIKPATTTQGSGSGSQS